MEVEDGNGETNYVMGIQELLSHLSKFSMNLVTPKISFI